jgi:acetoin utilization deacetylase AcuC-like enzyme
MNGLILPAVADWKPDLLLVSAGFDAHAADPLAGLSGRRPISLAGRAAVRGFGRAGGIEPGRRL